VKGAEAQALLGYAVSIMGCEIEVWCAGGVMYCSGFERDDGVGVHVVRKSGDAVQGLPVRQRAHVGVCVPTLWRPAHLLRGWAVCICWVVVFPGAVPGPAICLLSCTSSAEMLWLSKLYGL
jgi:hypothetical protein